MRLVVGELVPFQPSATRLARVPVLLDFAPLNVSRNGTIRARASFPAPSSTAF